VATCRTRRWTEQPDHGHLDLIRTFGFRCYRTPKRCRSISQVAFVRVAEFEQRDAQVFDGVETAHPGQSLLQGADKALGAAISFRRTDEGGRAGNAEEGDFLLEVIGHVLRAVVVAKGQAAGNVPGEAAARQQLLTTKQRPGDDEHVAFTQRQFARGAFVGATRATQHSIQPTAQVPAGYGDNMLWIITEADRSVTAFLLSDEY
jgi:hypothetical protein